MHLLDLAISKAREDENHVRKMLEELRMYCGGSLPPDGSRPANVEISGVQTNAVL